MKNGDPISVIIPVYNTAPFLTEAVESVIGQTYGNLEIILVDDGSTDGSGEMCDGFEGVRVIHQENKGLSAARNAGLEIATGEAIVFLDSDDAIHSRFVETMVEAMGDADLVICKYNDCKTTDKMTIGGRAKPAVVGGMLSREDALRALVESDINHAVWNKLYSRRLLENVRFPVGQVYEDIDVTFRVLHQCQKVVVVDEALLLHRLREGSITGTSSRKSIDDCLLSCDHFEGFVEQHPDIFTREQIQISHQFRLYMMIRHYLRTQEDKEFKKGLRKQIIETGKDISISGLFMKAFYWMIRCCPNELETVYRIRR